MTTRTEMERARDSHLWCLERLQAGDEDAVRNRFETSFLTPERQRECVEQYTEWLQELEEATGAVARVKELEEALRISYPKTPVDCLLSTLSELEAFGTVDIDDPGEVLTHVANACAEARTALANDKLGTAAQGRGSGSVRPAPRSTTAFPQATAPQSSPSSSSKPPPNSHPPGSQR